MPVSRVVKPESKRLELSGDDWLLVKRRLNHGETTRHFLRGHDADGKPRPIEGALAKIAIYLLDWSLVGLDGQQIVIRGESLDAIIAAVNSLDPASVFEINAAILAHEDAIVEEIEAEKKTRVGASLSSPTSTSPGPVAGGTSGSATSIPTSTAS
jgi:hypothetical protein